MAPLLYCNSLSNHAIILIPGPGTTQLPRSRLESVCTTVISTRPDQRFPPYLSVFLIMVCIVPVTPAPLQHRVPLACPLLTLYHGLTLLAAGSCNKPSALFWTGTRDGGLSWPTRWAWEKRLRPSLCALVCCGTAGRSAEKRWWFARRRS